MESLRFEDFEQHRACKVISAGHVSIIFCTDSHGSGQNDIAFGGHRGSRGCGEGRRYALNVITPIILYRNSCIRLAQPVAH